MDLVNLTHEALHRYFTRLFQSGYMKYSNVKSLIVLLYIQELISNFDFDIDEQAIIDKALACLQGSSCMIPYTGCKGACI